MIAWEWVLATESGWHTLHHDSFGPGESWRSEDGDKSSAGVVNKDLIDGGEDS